jgi:hypothetical protein
MPPTVRHGAFPASDRHTFGTVCLSLKAKAGVRPEPWLRRPGGCAFHFSTTMDAYGLKGLGMISGAQYTSNDRSVDDVNLGPSQTADVINRLILNAQGPIDNFYAYDHLKFTVNANGVPMVSFDAPKTGCNG